MISSTARDLSTSNTMALPCTAERYFLLKNDLDIVDFFTEEKGDVLVLGGGSNVILPPILKVPVVQVAHSGIDTVEDEADQVTLTVGASVIWDDLVAWSVKKGFFGLENLSLIPGSVGAAPVQNIGAYGVELKDTLLRVRAFDRVNNVFVELENEDCRFAYRDSIFKRESGRYLITQVTLRLSKNEQYVLDYGELKAISDSPELSLAKVRDTVISVRLAKLPDPTVIPNTGSFFKNPVVSIDQADSLKSRFPAMVSYALGEGEVKLAAGWLIDHAGLKGFKLGKASVHNRQALVLTNSDGAAQEDILKLAEHIKAQVFDLYGVVLEQEPITIE